MTQPALAAPPDDLADTPGPPARRRHPGRQVWQRITVVVLLLLLACVAIEAGLRLRRTAWTATDGAHFRGDISSGWNWGDRALRRGLFSFYDDLDADVRAGRSRRNDYPPLRLAVMTAWVQWTHTHYPAADRWQDDYDFTAPLLHANTAAELASSVLVFLIVRLLRVRQAAERAAADVAARPGFFTGMTAGLAGAVLFWFNPAVLWDGHCWPQWDVWLMPFFLAAVLAACLDAWFTAGLCLVVGALFKGQLLLGAPVLLLWPLFAGRVDAVLRLGCGLVVATAAAALPWMRPGNAAWVWCATTLVACAFVVYALGRRPVRPRVRAGLLVAALLLAWPWASGAAWSVRLAAWTPLLFAAILPVRPKACVAASAFAAAVLLTMALFDASTTWFTMGLVYGTDKFAFMLTGSGSWNAPAMAVEYLQWPRDPNSLVNLPGLHGPTTQRVLWRTAYALTLVLCGVGAAVQARRRDTRLLAALVAPWLLCFMLMPQMHGRYSVWAAGFSALLAGVSTGMTLLCLLVSVVAWLGIVENQYLFVPDYAPDTLALLRRLDPHLGWVLLLAAAIYLYVAIAPRRESPRGAGARHCRSQSSASGIVNSENGGNATEPSPLPLPVAT